MCKRTILMVRHGQYAATTKPPVEPDGALMTLGQKQAARIGERLANVWLDGIYSSTLVRAVETADFIAAHHPHAPRQTLPDLREAIPSVPVALEHHFAQLPTQFLQESALWCRRAFETLFVPSPTEEEETILLVAHGNIISFFASQVVQAPIDSWVRFDIMHASLCQAFVTKRMMKLVQFNDVGHLRTNMQTFA